MAGREARDSVREEAEARIVRFVSGQLGRKRAAHEWVIRSPQSRGGVLGAEDLCLVPPRLHNEWKTHLYTNVVPRVGYCGVGVDVLFLDGEIGYRD